MLLSFRVLGLKINQYIVLGMTLNKIKRGINFYFLFFRFNLSPDQGKFALPTFSVLNTVIADICPRPSNCPGPTKYREADGSCNNLQHEQWGRSGVALQRILPPKYGDGEYYFLILCII